MGAQQPILDQQPPTLPVPIQHQQPELAPVAASTLVHLSCTSLKNNLSASSSQPSLNNDLFNDDNDNAKEDILEKAWMNGCYREFYHSIRLGWRFTGSCNCSSKAHIKQDVCEQHGLQPFYKSYTQWEKMTMNQRNKSLAWFCKLPDHSKGKLIFYVSFVFSYKC
jgi:hypothetical protein